MSGELGSGKTTFVKGLAAGFGIKENISSPTFVLIKEHSISLSPPYVHLRGVLKLVHVDLYRLLKQSDIASLGLSDFLGKKEYICVIEWAEKIKDYLKKFGKKVKWIEFKHIDKNTREIRVKIFNS